MRNAKVVDKYYERENSQLYNHHLNFKAGLMEQKFSYLNGFPGERKNILVLIKGMACDNGVLSSDLNFFPL